jgi:hypothetical protein
MHRQRDFLLLVVLAAAAAATSALGHAVAPLAGPTGGGTASTASVPDFSGIWTRFSYEFDRPLFLEERQHIAALQLPAKNHFTIRIDAVDLKN